MSECRSREMLVFDAAYTHAIMVERDLFDLVTGRDLDGYFDHVWTVHPVASLVSPEDAPDRIGRPVRHAVSARHTILEGKIGRFRWLNFLPPLNFLLAQWDLLRQLSRLIKERRICVIRAEDPWYNGAFALLLARLHRLPLMIGVWGNPGAVRKQTGQPVLRRLFRKVWPEEVVEGYVLRRASLVMIQNEDNRRFVLSKGVPRERTDIFRIGNLIHRSHFREPSERDDGRPDLAAVGAGGRATLICISRLQDLKLVDHVVRVARILKDRGRDVTVLVVGEGPFRDELAALADDLGVSEQVRLLGNRDQSWLCRVIPRVTAVLSPLTGRALAEAALAGAPIVAYDVDWHSELIETGVTGELVPYLDYVAMAEAVERIIDRPDYAGTIGANARRRALGMMDPAAADRAQIAAYEKLLGPASIGAEAAAGHAR